MHPTARLPRAWWFPDLKGYRSTETGTYVCYPLDEQPKVSVADDEFRWLEDTPERDDGIKDGEPGQQTRPLTTEHLAALAQDLPLPHALRTFAARPALQRRVRSVTAWHLDLGDFVAPTRAPTATSFMCCRISSGFVTGSFTSTDLGTRPCSSRANRSGLSPKRIGRRRRRQ
jgi:hypothetical protein